MAREKEIKLISKLTKELLSKLGLKAEIEVVFEDEAFRVNLKSDNPAKIIGFHGKTLNSLQLILGLMAWRAEGEWLPILVDVADYRQEQKKRLEDLASRAIERVKQTGEPASLSPMTPFERRVVHMTVSKDSSVESRSEGEGEQRHVVIYPIKS